MKDTNQTSQLSGKASADKPAKYGNTRYLLGESVEDVPTTDSGRHANIKLSEEGIAVINEIFKGTAFFKDSPTVSDTQRWQCRFC